MLRTAIGYEMVTRVSPMQHALQMNSGNNIGKLAREGIKKSESMLTRDGPRASYSRRTR